MKCIGIRVEPTEIYYSIIEFENNGFKFKNQKLILPKALKRDTPRLLSYIRTSLFSIICEYDIKNAGIRTAEGSAKNLNIFRINIEGVVQELFADSTIQNYVAGTYTSFASRIGTTSTIVKENCDGKRNDLQIAGWEKFNKSFRECIFAALSSAQYRFEVIQ